MSKSEVSEPNINLTVVGGTYFESCLDPDDLILSGSGVRGATALAGKGFDITLVSYVGQEEQNLAKHTLEVFNVNIELEVTNETIKFDYYHPLSKPYIHPEVTNRVTRSRIISSENILFYGFYEINAQVDGDYVVYDPQNLVSFKETKSTANHLAIILNRNEAHLLSNLPDGTPLKEIGEHLLLSEHAEVVVIKNGAKGALMITKDDAFHIPIYQVDSIWPIGSGDIFTATFAWKWAIEKHSPYDSAMIASCYTALYCSTRVLPLPIAQPVLNPRPISSSVRKIYLAGPFFTVASRWLVNELYEILIEFGNIVFSPFHDVGFGLPNEIASKDLKGLRDSDVVLAVVSGLDSGTLFEIGYAVALNKRVVVFAENVSKEDLLMLIGTNCEITDSITNAIYWASW